MPKKKKKIEVVSEDSKYFPYKNILKAKIVSQPDQLSKLDFNSRYFAMVETGVSVKEIPNGCVLKFSLMRKFAEKGMVLTTDYFNGNGKVCIGLVNCGREIISVWDGDDLVYVWLEEPTSFEWEEFWN